MKKKLLWIAGILGALILLATVFGPMLVLAAARQPEPETGFAYSDSFLTTYEEVRSHLTELASELGAEQGSHLLDEGLFIDSFYLFCRDSCVYVPAFDAHARCYERSGCHYGAALHHSVVQHYCSHSYQAVILNGGSVYHRVVTYRHIVAYDGLRTLVKGVYHRAILYVHLVAYPDAVHIAAKHCAVPY